jgi:hypothetical protein
LASTPEGEDASPTSPQPAKTKELELGARERERKKAREKERKRERKEEENDGFSHFLQQNESPTGTFSLFVRLYSQYLPFILE